jgi:hypothetical protein
MVVGITLQNGQKYTDDIVHPETARSGKINKRPFVEQQNLLGTGGTCQFGLEAGPTARVLVLVTTGTDTNAACAKALDVATAVEPELPKL